MITQLPTSDILNKIKECLSEGTFLYYDWSFAIFIGVCFFLVVLVFTTFIEWGEEEVDFLKITACIAVIFLTFVFDHVIFANKVIDPFMKSLQVKNSSITMPTDKMSRDYINEGNPIYVASDTARHLLQAESISYRDDEKMQNVPILESLGTPEMEIEIMAITYDAELYQKAYYHISGYCMEKLNDLLLTDTNGIVYNIKSIQSSDDVDALQTTYSDVAIPQCDLTIDLREDATIPTDKGSLNFRGLKLTREVSDNPKIELKYGNPHLSNDVNNAEVQRPGVPQITVGRMVYDCIEAKLYAPQYSAPAPQSATTAPAPKVNVSVDVNVDVNGN